MQVGTLHDNQLRAVGLHHANGRVLVDDLLNAVASDQHAVGINDNGTPKPCLVDGLLDAGFVRFGVFAVIIAVLNQVRGGLDFLALLGRVFRLFLFAHCV